MPCHGCRAQVGDGNKIGFSTTVEYAELGEGGRIRGQSPASRRRGLGRVSGDDGSQEIRC